MKLMTPTHLQVLEGALASDHGLGAVAEHGEHGLCCVCREVCVCVCVCARARTSS